MKRSNVLFVALCLVSATAEGQEQAAVSRRPALAMLFTDSVTSLVTSCFAYAWEEALDYDIQFLEIRRGQKPDTSKAVAAQRKFEACEDSTHAYVERTYREARDVAGTPPTAVAALKEFYAYIRTAVDGVALSSKDIVGSNTSRVWRSRADPFLQELRTRAERVRAEY